MFARQLTISPGPRRDIYTKQYGKFRVDVYLLTLHRVMVYEMDGYITGDQIESYIDDLLAAANAAKPVAMIADPRKMKVLSPEFQRAIQGRFWPAIAKLGVKRNPAIVPPSVVTATSVRRMVSGMGQTITLNGGFEMQIAMLESVEECLEWISLA